MTHSIWSYEQAELPRGDDYTHYDVDEPPDSPDGDSPDGDGDGRGCDCPHQPGCALGDRPSWWARIHGWLS